MIDDLQKDFAYLQLKLRLNLITANEGYLIDEKGNLYMTKDGAKTWTSQKLHFKDEPFYTIYYSPTMAIRFTDTNHGIIIGNRKRKNARMIVALITNDGGLTWKEEPVASGSGSLFLSRDGKMLTIVNFSGTTLTVLQKVD